MGREGELAALRSFLQRPVEAPTALVLDGEAGIGKSTLWRVGVEEAVAAGFRVLVSRPAEAEQELAPRPAIAAPSRRSAALRRHTKPARLELELDLSARQLMNRPGSRRTHEPFAG